MSDLNSNYCRVEASAPYPGMVRNVVTIPDDTAAAAQLPSEGYRIVIDCRGRTLQIREMPDRSQQLRVARAAFERLFAIHLQGQIAETISSGVLSRPVALVCDPGISRPILAEWRLGVRTTGEVYARTYVSYGDLRIDRRYLSGECQAGGAPDILVTDRSTFLRQLSIFEARTSQLEQEQNRVRALEDSLGCWPEEGAPELSVARIGRCHSLSAGSMQMQSQLEGEFPSELVRRFELEIASRYDPLSFEAISHTALALRADPEGISSRAEGDSENPFSPIRDELLEPEEIEIGRRARMFCENPATFCQCLEQDAITIAWQFLPQIERASFERWIGQASVMAGRSCAGSSVGF